MYKVVVFDMQGMLIHKDDVLSESLRRVLVRHGMDMPDGRAMRLYRMLPPYSFIKEYYALSPDDAGAIASAIRAEQETLAGSKAGAYDGAADALKTLRERGLKLYAVSPWSVGEAGAILRNTGLQQLIDKIYQKPPRGSVLELLSLGEKVEYSRLLYVGDCVDDMDEAEKAGCAFIPSLYGYGFERDDSACPYPVPVLHDIRELPAALEKLER